MILFSIVHLRCGGLSESKAPLSWRSRVIRGSILHVSVRSDYSFVRLAICQVLSLSGFCLLESFGAFLSQSSSSMFETGNPLVRLSVFKRDLPGCSIYGWLGIQYQADDLSSNVICLDVAFTVDWAFNTRQMNCSSLWKVGSVQLIQCTQLAQNSHQQMAWGQWGWQRSHAQSPRTQRVSTTEQEHLLWKDEFSMINWGHQMDGWPLRVRLCASPDIFQESNSKVLHLYMLA